MVHKLSPIAREEKKILRFPEDGGAAYLCIRNTIQTKKREKEGFIITQIAE